MTNYDNDVEYITEEGYQKIKEELEYLKTVKREEIAAKLEIAIKQGDLKENADYHSAKEELGFAEGRIRDLEDALHRAKIIKEVGPSNVVKVGHTVTVVEEGYNEPETYHIVGPHEADPSKGMISNESPLGQALIGSRKGKTVSVLSPGGKLRFQIQKIE